MNKKKILWLGENCIDRFIFCSANRFAPDKKIPVLEAVKITENPGMAGNSYANFISLFPQHETHFIHQEQIITKTRFCNQDEMQYYLRYDENDKIKNPLTIEELKNQLDKKNLTLDDFNLIAISDYGKGYISKELIKYLADNHIVFLDTKYILGSFSRNVRCCKINAIEWQNNLNAGIITKECQTLIVTKGASGAELRDMGQITLVPGRTVETRDVSGLGDTYLSSLVGLYLEDRYTWIEMMKISNYLCSFAAKQLGVAVMKPEDLEKAKKLAELL